jgi:hypothetical protein
MSNEQKPADNRSASQKIADIENAVLSLLQTTQNLVRDVMTLKETAKLLNNKTSSIAQAAVKGELPTDEVLTRIMVENNVAELEKKTQELVASGNLVPQDQVTDHSFVVGSEQDDDGKTVNPRIQFALANIKEGQADVAAKFLGTKPGDIIEFGPGKLKFRVDQTYLIQEPTSPDAAPEAAPAALSDASAPTATDSTATPDATPTVVADAAPATEAPAAQSSDTPAPTPAPEAPAAQ